MYIKPNQPYLIRMKNKLQNIPIVEPRKSKFNGNEIFSTFRVFQIIYSF